MFWAHNKTSTLHMMKQKQYNILLLLLAVLSLGFSSCQSLKDTPASDFTEQEEEHAGTTYFNFQITTAQDPLRGDNPDPEDEEIHNPLGYWEGQDLVESISLFMLSGTDTGGKVEYFLESEPKLFTPGTASQNAVYGLREPRKTTPGKKELYVFVNLKRGSDLYNRLIVARTPAKFKEELKKPLQMSETKTSSSSGTEDIAQSDYARANVVGKDGKKYDVILMTAPGKVMNIDEGVSAKEAIDHPHNSATIKVRRVIAKVLVTRAFDPEAASEESAKYEVKRPKSDKVIFTLSDFSYTIMQMEKTSSVIAVKTQELKFDDTTNKHKETYTPNHDWVPADKDDFEDGAGELYAYDFRDNPRERLYKFDRKQPEPEQIQQIAKLQEHMSFVTETTHQYGVRLDAAAGVKTAYRKGNTAYVLIRCKITPDPSMFGSDKDDGYGDIYYGLVDGKFYKDLDEAIRNNESFAEKAPMPPLRMSNPNIYYLTFMGGYCYYYLWINPDVIDPTDWKNSPVVRNNIYHINILGFNSLGFTGNPFNPLMGEGENPFIPDRYDTLPGPEEPLYNDERMVSAEISVLKWRQKSAKVKI